MFNYKLAEIAHEVDKINLNELTPIDALNVLVRIKEKWNRRGVIMKKEEKRRIEEILKGTKQKK